LAYLDLNPVRAGLVKRPEDYRWCSLGYHVQTRNKGKFLSLDFGLREFGIKSGKDGLRYYRRFVYEKGGLEGVEKERGRDFEVGKVDRFLLRTRYFTDSGIIGSKAYVSSFTLPSRIFMQRSGRRFPNGLQALKTGIGDRQIML
jgi:putative transposase